MKLFYAFILTLLFSSISFSQVITFECNNEIITVSFDSIANNPNAYMDWDGDGIVNESDYLIYLNQVYGCDDDTVDCEEMDYIIADCECSFFNPFTYTEFFTTVDQENCVTIEDCMCVCINDENDNGICDEEESDIWTDIILNDSNWNNNFGTDTLNWNNDFDWDANGDGEDDFQWDDFEWSDYWDDLDLDSIIDWENTPWGNIIDFYITPEDFINYIIEVIISGGQPFDWNSFISNHNSSVLNINDKLVNDFYLVQTLNLFGQLVNSDSKGVYLINLYSDGSVKKEYLIK